jgi:hypothetical protein
LRNVGLVVAATSPPINGMAKASALGTDGIETMEQCCVLQILRRTKCSDTASPGRSAFRSER